MDVDSPNSLKRCSSAPQINNLLPTTAVGEHHPIVPMDEGQTQQDSRPSPIAQQQSSFRQNSNGTNTFTQQQQHHQQHYQHTMSSNTSSLLNSGTASNSFSPLAVISNGSSSPSRSGSCTPGPRLTPRISQLRQEECADVSNSREVNHEREIHSAMQMSQSYEDLTLVTENWSFSSSAKNNDDLINPLHVALPSIGTNYCSSPSPTSRGGIGLQYPTTSPSPTRKFVTRRSMSPCPIRPSPLSSSVKRKFDLEDNNYGNCYSPPPLKKIFTSERGSSPVYQTPSPSPICPSPDSSTASFENGSNNVSNSGRITPKFFVTKLSAAQAATTPLSGNGSNGANGGTAATICITHPLHNESPPSSSSSSSLMMMDCGVSSSSSGHNQLKLGSKVGQPNATTAVTSSGNSKMDSDEDIVDMNLVASTTSRATTDSSEAAMDDVVKATRRLEDQSEPELLDSSSSAISNSHRLSTGSVSNMSNENNSESSNSLCPLAFESSVLAAATSTAKGNGVFLANNIEIAET
ncbi:uncharacterized protein DDB_G0271670 isoform X2 [Toxorhynchites rutilus septentrionalis]|uniref:uncharacterized protein DDB_G0271670 isoform X2 n=1 Tax=Toxorhynchites rutilus septentrionalis TaxID=329112 RepID=UPI00247B21F3|nr:uncharacterized protein DDB_G0271670 isoform X2 [Toxorhynchites rutilus septentrionalis]